MTWHRSIPCVEVTPQDELAAAMLAGHMGYSTLREAVAASANMKITLKAAQAAIRAQAEEIAELRDALSSKMSEVAIYHVTTDDCPYMGQPWPCCYEIWAEGAIRYVGQTTNLRQRIRQHWSADTHRLASDFAEWMVAAYWAETPRIALLMEKAWLSTVTPAEATTLRNGPPRMGMAGHLFPPVPGGVAWPGHKIP